MNARTLLFLSLAALAAAPAAARDYWRVVGEDAYRRMSQFERRQYDKALRLLNDRQYRAAATEFERFTIQYGDSDAMPYMVFLRAYSLHSAGTRNQAIGIYDEVLDFYPDETAAAAPALYYRGRAQLDNGDSARGVATLRAFLADGRYAAHPVGFLARIDLAHSEMRAKNYDRAEKLLRETIEGGAQTPGCDDVRWEATRQLVAMCVCQPGRLERFALWYATAKLAKDQDDAKVDPAGRRRGLFGYASDILWHHWTLFRDANAVAQYCPDPRRCPSRERELWDAMGAHATDWTGEAQRYDYAWRRARLSFRAGRAISRQEFEGAAREAVENAAKLPPDENDKNRAQTSLQSLFDLFADNGRLEAATLANSRVTDAHSRVWNQARLLELEGKWKESADYLAAAEGEAKDAAARTKLALHRAEILRDRLHDYDAAIKVYLAYSNPPATLWRIAECQRAKRDLAGAMKTLREIEAAFPDEGAEAAYRRAEYQDQIGDGKLAVKEARGVLKRYPRSGASSKAHQLLERYGIDTGGAERD